MSIFNSLRLALMSVAALATLSGCGEAGPQSRTAETTPYVTAHSVAGFVKAPSWVLPTAKNQNLLYVVQNVASEVYIFSYPKGDLMGTLSGFDSPAGACVDKAGNVWITNQFNPPEIVEYAHGGTSPIATLSDSERPNGCSVDPVTGNLAVTNDEDVAVYPNASGTPTTYTNDDITNFLYCTYDDAGNLFADGEADGLIAELPNGSGTLQTVNLNKDIIPRSLQWDGSYVAIVDGRGAPTGPTPVDRVQIFGSGGTVVGTTLLKSPGGRRTEKGPQYWISGGMIVGGNRYRGRGNALTVLLWRYPKGGKPVRVIYKGDAGIQGTVVSSVANK